MGSTPKARTSLSSAVLSKRSERYWSAPVVASAVVVALFVGTTVVEAAETVAT